MRRKYYICFLLLLLWSCDKEEVGPQQDVVSDVVGDLSQGVLIGCEGNFGSSNASVSHYDNFGGVASNNVYQATNSTLLGDVLQSIFQDNDRTFFVVNNSSKILVTDGDLELSSTIELNNRSPRYMTQGAGKLWVSNFAFNPNGNPVYIDVLDAESLTHIDSINVGTWTEELAVWNDHLYVANMGGSSVFQISLSTHEVVGELQVGREPISLVLVDDELWVLCTGGFQEELASLWKIDLGDGTSTAVNADNIEDYPARLVYSPVSDQLYYLNSGVHQVSREDVNWSIAPIITGDSPFYSMAIDPDNGDIYVSDANAFIGSGSVVRYSSDAVFLDQFEVGVGPSSFLFR